MIMIVLLLTKQIAELFIIMFFGYILVKSGILKTEDSKVLSVIALYLIIPCVTINAFQIEYSAAVRDGLILAFAAALVVHILFIVITKGLGKIFSFNSVERASVIYTNAGNLIIPIVISVLGPEWVVYCSGYLIVQLIFIWSHGRMMICEDKTFHIKKLLMNINMIASGVGMLLFAFRVPLPLILSETFSTVSSMIGPICMINAGMLIAGMNLKKIVVMKRIYLVAFFKMLAVPFCILALFKLSGAASLVTNGETVLLISLLASIAPTAATVTQMAQIYGRDAEYASAIYFLTTVLCIVTMPLMVWLYQI